MKKIMFNDKYGLTQAVLEGRKTMTRRVVSQIQDGDQVGVWDAPYIELWRNGQKHEIFPAYQVGEEVAVAQNYEQAGWKPDTLQQAWVKKPTIFPDLDEYQPLCGWVDLPFKYHKGWTNKMFVLADLMPHRIRITGIKVERLQDISDADILREGVQEFQTPNGCVYVAGGVGVGELDRERIRCGRVTIADTIKYDTAQEAFAALIDKVSGRGTWDSNPYVFAYEFELVR